MKLKEFSNELKEAREKSGVELQIIATKTRIDLKFLEALEEGDFNFLPDLYVKAFIRQYAKEIGLDEDDTLQKFNIAREKIKKPSAKEDQSESENEKDSGLKRPTKSGNDLFGQIRSFIDESTHPSSASEDTKKQYTIVLGVAGLGVILVSALIFFIFFNNSDEIIVEEKPYEEVLKETPARFIEEATITPDIENDASALNQLTLTIANVDSVDSAWVYVITDGINSREFLLLPNISSSVVANNNFRFTLGNSGVIKLTLNDEEIQFDGRRGAVRHFKVDRNGIERIYLPPQVEQE